MKDSKQLLTCLKKEEGIVRTNYDVIMEGMGNSPQEFNVYGKSRVGVTFFERSNLTKEWLEHSKNYDIIITGSRWNQETLERHGVKNATMVHQGIDLSRFNAVPVPRLIKKPLVIFAGGKLEARKGQDIVIEAFKKFSKPAQMLC